MFVKYITGKFYIFNNAFRRCHMFCEGCDQPIASSAHKAFGLLPEQALENIVQNTLLVGRCSTLFFPSRDDDIRKLAISGWKQRAADRVQWHEISLSLSFRVGFLNVVITSREQFLQIIHRVQKGLYPVVGNKGLMIDDDHNAYILNIYPLHAEFLKGFFFYCTR